MIQVSNEFKTAIKKPERQIKGYVEVLYQNVTSPTTPTTDITSTYTDISQAVDGNRVVNDYGTLDYLPLDGSRLTMDTSDNINSGFISDDLAGDVENGTITFNISPSITLNGMSFYFKDNHPTTTMYKITTSDSSVYSRTLFNNEIDLLVFANPLDVVKIEITFIDWKYNDRRIKIAQIDLGITEIYKDQDLIEFTIDEEVNKLVEEVPINECSITLNNMNNLFNPLNPLGVVPFLNKKSLIIPYIGVLTENLGVEYVKMGEFYFDSYTNNEDKTTTLIGKNIIKELEKEILKIDTNEYNLFSSSMSKANFQTFMNNYNYTFNNLDFLEVYQITNISNKYLINLIKEISFFNSTLFYSDRNSELNLKIIDNTIQDTLTKSELINDAEYKQIDKINTLIHLSPTSYTMNVTGSRLIYEREMKLEKATQIVLCESNIPNMMDSIAHVDGASSVSVISQGYYFTFLKITGTVGSTITIRMASSYEMVESIGTETKTIKDDEEQEVPINFDTKLVRGINTIETLDYTPSYEMKFDYNGDPSLEAGDYISVQTSYGYTKNLFIQKNYFKFDGGLEGRIEGVE